MTVHKGCDALAPLIYKRPLPGVFSLKKRSLGCLSWGVSGRKASGEPLIRLYVHKTICGSDVQAYLTLKACWVGKLKAPIGGRGAPYGCEF